MSQAGSDRTPCSRCDSSPPLPKRAYRDADTLRHLYLDHDLTQGDLADAFGCSKTTVKNWLNEHDISKSSYQYDIPESELRELYFDRGLTIKEAAEHFGCSYIALRNRLQNYEIPIRSQAEAAANPDDDSYRDEEWLRQQYHDEELSKKAIADSCGVAPGTIQYWMDKYDIEARDLSEAHTRYHERRDDSYTDEDELRRLYWEEKLTQREIADHFGVSQVAIQSWMDKYNIQLRYAGAHGKTYQTDRGEYVRSSPERTIADWLHSRKVDYTYEPDAGPEGLCPDFLIDGNLVEYWGMLGREEYVFRMHEKVQTYERAGVEVVHLFPHDLTQLKDKLSQLV